MLTIDRYIIRQVLLPTLFGLALLMLLFTAFTSVRLLRSATVGNLPVDDVLALLVAHDLGALEILLPSAFFAALMMVMSSWHREGEPYALYASGVTPDRLSRPLWLLALIVALCVGALSVYGRPYSYQLRYDITERASNLTSAQMTPQRFYRWEDGFVIQAERIRRSAPNLQQVFARAAQDGQPLVLRAERGHIGETTEERIQTVEFLNGSSALIGSGTALPLDTNHAGTPAPPGTVTRTGDRITRFDRLLYHIQRTPGDVQTKRRARATAELATSSELRDIAEFQWRLSMPMIAFLLALMAIELGRLRPRQSPYPRFGIAIALYAVVFNLTSATMSAVENGTLPPVPGVYSAVVVLGLVYLALRRIPRLSLRHPA